MKVSITLLTMMTCAARRERSGVGMTSTRTLPPLPEGRGEQEKSRERLDSPAGRLARVHDLARDERRRRQEDAAVGVVHDELRPGVQAPALAGRRLGRQS